MNFSNPSDDQIALIGLLHIKSNEISEVHRLVNACWFKHQLHTVTNKAEEDVFFQILAERVNRPDMYEAIIADFRRKTPISMNSKLELIDYLRRARCPLISLTETHRLSVHEEGLNWIHISMPAKNIPGHINQLREIMTNFWFSLPAK